MRPGFAAPFILLLLAVFASVGASYGNAMEFNNIQLDTTKKERPKHSNGCTAIGNLTGTTCIGSQLKASVSTEAFAPIASAEWYSGNSPVLTQTTGPFVYTPPVTGTYYVKLITTEGCPVTTNSVTISALKQPVMQISTPSNVVCNTFPTPSFTGIPTYNGEHPTYQWKVNGIAVGPVVTEVVTPFKPTGLKKGDVVTCEMTSTDDCITTPVVQSNEIVIDDVPDKNPSATVALLTTTPCAGSALTFEAFPVNTGNVTVYLWSVNEMGAGNGDKKTFTSTNLKDGDKVSCTVISTAKFCQDYISFVSDPVTVNFIPQVTPEISIAQTNVDEGTSVTYTATIKNGGTTPVYQWKVNQLYVADNSPTYMATKLLPGDKVTCTLISNADCATVDEVTSTPIINTLIVPFKKEMPNLFTPNGDGVNDTWMFPGAGTYHNAKVRVYNRLGAQVFHTSGAASIWDGKTDAGKPCPSGVYFYFVSLDSKQTLSGAVTILR